VMAVRPAYYGACKEAMTALAAALAGYTDFAELRRKQRFTKDLPRLLGSLPHSPTDLLAIRLD